MPEQRDPSNPSRRREEVGTGGVGGSLRRNGPLALAVTATLAAVLIPQASAGEGSPAADAAVVSKVAAGAEVDRVGLVERYMGQKGSVSHPGNTPDSSGDQPGSGQDKSDDGGPGDPNGKDESGQGKSDHGGKGQAGQGDDDGGHSGDHKDSKQEDQDKDSLPKDSDKSDELSAPLEKLEPTSSFGPRISPITGAPSEFHTGQDYAGTCGTPVESSADGKVTEAGWHPYGGGMRITVSHGDGLKTTYNHMSSMGASVGDTVDEGDRIGRVGSTGASTGCHLHFEVVVDGDTVNPLKWI